MTQTETPLRKRIAKKAHAVSTTSPVTQQSNGVEPGDVFRDELNDTTHEVTAVDGGVATIAGEDGETWREATGMIATKVRAGDYTPVDEMEQSKDTGQKATVTIPDAEDAQILYPTQEQAEMSAEQMGLEPNAHEHAFGDDGETWYMPGRDHDEYETAVTQLGFADYESFDDCVAANSDKDDPEAYCASIKRQVEGKSMDATDQKGEFSEGEAVMWTWDGEPVHGRIAEERPEQATVSGNTITGDDDEPVYVIDEFDDRVEAFRRENVAKPESSLNESSKDLPDRSEGNYVSAEAWESLTTTVAQSDFTAPEMDHMAADMDGVLHKLRPNEWLLPSADDPVVFRYEIDDQYLDGRSEEFFVPNEGVADAPRKVKEWEEEHGDDVAGGASDGEGSRRGTQLIEHAERGEPLAVEYWEEIANYHNRHHPQGSHELDDEATGEPWTDAGYVSHLNWGGDAGYSQAEDIMEVVDSVESELRVEMKGAVTTEQSLSPTAITKRDSNEVDVEALEGELREAVEADDFYVYGKASIEQWDDDTPPTYIDMEALEAALDRYFNSETEPGIISRHHQDIPVGTPVREFEFESDTTLEIDDEQYSFAAGDVARSHVEDADGDGRPELWLAANIGNSTEMGKKTRVLAAQGDLNGFSVTVHRNRDEMTSEGRMVTDCDLHAVTIGSDSDIKNPGSEFDVASYKGPVEKVAEVVRGLF